MTHFSPILNYGRIVSAALLFSAFAPMPAGAQTTQVARVDGPANNEDAYAARSGVRVGMRPGTPAVNADPLNNCGDALSAALAQGTQDFPCWADIRTVDRWNAASLDEGIVPGQERASRLPLSAPSHFSFAPGGFSGWSLPGDSEGKVYGGLAGVAGLIERPRWQLMAEDGGGLADLQYSGAHLVGLNRSAIQATGSLTPRWSWQGAGTNTYGTDAARQFAPLDYRVVGQSEIPAPDTVFYGLHSGRMTSGEEEVRLRYADTRHSAWDFSASHDYTRFGDTALLTQTARASAEYLQSVGSGVSLGFYGAGAHQTSPLSCDLGGAGLRLLSGWRGKNSLNLNGEVDGASQVCGKRVVFRGGLSFYTRLTASTDWYVSAGRDLSNGVLQPVRLLNSGGTGIRHSFGKKADLRLGVNSAYGTTALIGNSYHGWFADGSLHYHLAGGFSQEMELRRFSASGDSLDAARTAAVFTLWWTPGTKPEPSTYRESRR